ncbi:MAG TPA: hypothetical protein VI461_08305 [Chitinophagaceae bacterium]|nr:hypothetical protein [Chitinophagaceae bacterium]
MKEILHDKIFWILICIESLITFFIMLNSYLRGASKSLIDVVLGLMYVTIIILMWIIFNWAAAIIAFLYPMLFGAIVMGLAKRLAANILKKF